MRDLSYIQNYYTNHINEDERLVSKHGAVEFITTMKYIHDLLEKEMKILEIGAGTGRYSLALAHEGFEVHAIELVQHNIDLLKSKITPTDNLTVHQGDALDLSLYEDNTFDCTLVFGPMYHLYHLEDKRLCLSEAIRVTKPKGKILVAYCMNEAAILQMCFLKGKIHECIEEKMIGENYKCLSQAKDLFEMVRTEEIDEINQGLNVKREKLIATDGAAHYFKDVIDAMDEKTYQLYLDYHLATCERADCIGASNHTCDILTKVA